MFQIIGLLEAFTKRDKARADALAGRLPPP